MNRLIAVITLTLVAQSEFARSQGVYDSVAKTDVMDCVMDFVENRQKFASFGCLMEQDHSSGRSSGLQSTLRTTIVFENSKDKLHRSDTIHSRSGEDPVKGVSIMSSPYRVITLTENDKSRYFLNETEYKDIHKKFQYNPDPWMVPLCHTGELMLAAVGESSFWQKLFDEQDLLWAESNLVHLRTEWKWGSGEGLTYVQVYFAKQHGNMPVLVRFIVPKDPTKRFVKVGKTMVSENQIEWKPLREGLVPIEVRSTEEQYWSSKPGLKSSDSSTIKFYWNSKLCSEKGEVRPEVFEQGKLSTEDLRQSFQIKENRKGN